MSGRVAILGVAGALLVLSGCGSSDVQTGAATFVSEHARTAVRAATAVKAVEAQTARLSSPPTGAQLQRLAPLTALARRATVRASEWDVPKSDEGGEEGAEEEDLPRAETEGTTAANELAKAMSALQAYARAPSASALARYRSELAHAKEVWNESISQLWFLAHRSGPPNI